MRLAVVLLLAACSKDPGRPPRRAAPADAAPAAVKSAGCALDDHALTRAMPDRVVAIGDLHGDLAATRRALTLAGVIDKDDHWTGGKTTVVQTGDVLDRGGDEEAILQLFERLEGESAAAGGAFVWLLGNHELMNAAGDFRYVTDAGWADFADRAKVFEPGGEYARMLSGQDVATIVGDTVFSHAGFLPTWTSDLVAINRSARCWLDGHGPIPEVIQAEDGPLWTRAWGGPDADCDHLRQVLVALGVARMVVAHTPQETGANSLCDGALWRIDTGMSAAYGGPTQVLELTASGARVLSE